ncbi:MAG: Gfo/Idh/MocA family oxidoreductase [Armatimonadota bacterium]|nr:Gfo/Idh/MocA family oxidoreductase [Armatimonadota bacterium]
MRKLRVAVIGCGNVSRGHIRGWLDQPDRAQVVALVDVERAFAEERRAQFGLTAATVATDWREVIAREDVDVVNICTPGHLHAEIIMAALDAGKHVMTEKPTGWNLEECRKLRWYAARHPNLKVGVAYSLRYYPLNLRVRQLLAEGAVGRVMHAQGTHNHPHGCRHIFEEQGPGVQGDRAGGYIPGSEATGATHVFDLMRFLLGEVRDVFAFREVYGTFVLMRFYSGALGLATAATASDQGLATPHVLCIQGTEGTIVTQNAYQEGDAWSVAGYHGYLVRGKRKEPIPVTGSDTGHGDATRTLNFLDAVQKGAPLIAPLEDSVRTSELLHAIWDSHNHEIRVPVHTLGKTG